MDRKALQKIIDQLNYDWQRFTIDHFIHHIAAKRQRPIDVMGVPLTEISGICISLPDYDYIFFDSKRHQAVQSHIMLHELAHLVLDHVAKVKVLSSKGELKSLLIHINTRIPVSSDPKTRQEEEEAEGFAYLVQQEVNKSKRLNELTVTDKADDVHLPPFTGKFVKGSQDE